MRGQASRSGLQRSARAAQADAAREDIPLLQYPPHQMRIIFQGLLPDWESEQYAETHHLATRAACELQRYLIWPEVSLCPELAPEQGHLTSRCARCALSAAWFQSLRQASWQISM